MAYRTIPKYSKLRVNVDTTIQDADLNQKRQLKEIRENYFPDYEVFRPYLKHLYDADIICLY